MRIIKYGLTLRRIEESDIELIRTWRNSEAVRNNMLYREYITPEMQKKWFDSVNNYKNSYYIIEYNDEKIGLINEKNIDFELMSVESGIFLFGEKHLGSLIPVLASFILIEVGYYLMNGNMSFVQVKKDNPKAMEYNEKIGYFIYEEKEDHYIMAINKDSFEKATVKLRKAITNLYGNENMKFIIEPVDFKNGMGEYAMNVLDSLPEGTILQLNRSKNFVEVILNV